LLFPSIHRWYQVRRHGPELETASSIFNWLPSTYLLFSPKAMTASNLFMLFLIGIAAVTVSVLILIICGVDIVSCVELYWTNSWCLSNIRVSGALLVLQKYMVAERGNIAYWRGRGQRC
jgi:hypothetical protein